MVETSIEYEVRRAAFDLYGRSEIDSIQRTGHRLWQINMTDGGISFARLDEDGAIMIDPA